MSLVDGTKGRGCVFYLKMHHEKIYIYPGRFSFFYIL